jgi:hypothetical protein
MPKIPHHAFSIQYSLVTNRLPLEVIVSGDAGIAMTARAVWDTGAMRSVVTPDVAQSLKLAFIDQVTVTGVNNISKAPIALVSVILPNNIRITGLTVVVCDMRQGIDMLIGMDIISMGDMVICNGNDKTLFSFAFPPFQDKIDLVDKSEAANKRDDELGR